MRSGFAHRVPDAIIVLVGVGLLLSGCFATKAQVIENDSQTTAGPAIATPPPLEYLKNMTAISSPTRFSLDVVHQPRLGDVVVASGRPRVEVAKNVETTVIGWAVDLPAHRNADAVYVLLDGKLVTSCHIAIARPDVASALQDQVFAMSGFSCVIPSREFSAGTHRITLDIVAQGGHTYYAATPTTLLVAK